MAIHFSSKLSGSSATSASLGRLDLSGSQTPLSVVGASGSLFSVTDNFSGSLMSVSDISGIPILEVHDDDRVVMGSYSNPGLIVTGSVSQFNGNVGIGTSAPAGQNANGPILHLFGKNASGTLNEPQLVFQQTGEPAMSIGVNANLDSGAAMLFQTNGSNIRMVILEDGKVGIGVTSPANLLQVGSHVHVTSAGLVGIGLAAPETDLHIAAASPAVRFTDENVSNLKHQIIGGGDAGLEYSADFNNVANGYHRWDISGAEKMRLIESGNLGIGRSTPSYKLDVNGDLLVTKTSGNLARFTGAGASSFYITATGQITHTSTTGNLAFAINQAGAGDAFAVDSSALIVKADGKVGIGVSAPDSKLHIAGGAYNTSLTIQAAGSNSGIKFENVGGTALGYVYAQNTGEIGFLDTGTAWAIQHISGNSTNFKISNTQYAKLTTTGLGIGNAHNPTVMLDVKGGARMMGTGNSFLMQFVGSDGDADGSIYSNTNEFGLLDGDGAWAIRHQNDTKTEFRVNNTIAATVNATGIQIGTGAANNHFEIVKASARMRLFDGTNQVNFGLWDGSNYRLEGDANRPILITSYSTSGIKMGISGGTHFFINGSGLVGIGTATVDSPLHVYGGTANTAKFQSNSGATNLMFEDSSANLIGQLEFSTGTSQLVTRNTSTLKLGSNNVGTIYITDADNVGIGQSSPAFKLDVSGTGRFTSNVDIQGVLSLPAVGDDIHLGNTLATTPKIRFGTSSWANNIGLESYWTVHSTNQNEGFRFKDSGGTELFRLQGSNSTGGAGIRSANFYGPVVPMTDSSATLGTTGLRWSNFFTDAATVGGAVNVGGQILASNGSAAAPSYAFSSQASTGMYKPGTSQLYFSVNGTRKMRVETSQVAIEVPTHITGNSSVTGNLNVTGTVTAQEFHTEFVSASIMYDSGSTKFGDTKDDLHQFTGSVRIMDEAPGSTHTGTTLYVGSGSQHYAQFIMNGAAYGNSVPAGRKTILRLVNNAIGLGQQYNNGIEFSPYGNKAYAGVYFYWHGDITNGRLEFRTTTDGGTNLKTAMTITEDQRIGIGTVNPESPLDVNNSDGVYNSPVLSVRTPSQPKSIRRTFKRHIDVTSTVTTGNYFRLRIPQTYQTIHTNGGYIKVKVMWQGHHASRSTTQIYRATYHSNHGLSSNQYFGISEFTKIYDQQSPLSYASYEYTTQPSVSFARLTLNAYGGVRIHIVGGHGSYARYGSIEVEVNGSSDTTPTLEDRGTTADAASTLTIIDKTAVHVDSAGQVGIGTKSPIRALDIKASGDPGIRLESAGQNADVITLRNADGRIGFGRDAITTLSSGNVGIGNSSPAKALHIGDASNNTGNGTIRLQGYSAGGSGNYHDIISYGDNLQFYRNTTLLMHLNYNGNVGIGTTTTPEALTIGTISGAKNIAISIYSYFGSTYSGLYTLTGFNAKVNQVAGTHYVQIANTHGSAGYAYTLHRGYANGITFHTANGSTTAGTNIYETNERMRINGSGNVAIGNTSPAEKLHVTGTVRADTDGEAFQVHGASGTRYQYQIQNILAFENAGGVIRTAGSTALTLQTNSTTAITIDTSQNITLSGNISASSTSTGSFGSLTAVGDVNITADANNKYFINFKNHSGGAIGGFYNADSDGVFNVFDSSGATRVSLHSDNNSYFNKTGGNLGLGTNNPTSLPGFGGSTFHIKGSDASIRLQNNTGTFEIGADSNNDLKVYRDASNIAMIIKNSGNVGIGSTAPAQTLDVVGGGAFTTSVFFNGRVRINHDGQVHWGASYNQGYLSWNTNEAIIGGLASNALRLQSGGATTMFMDTSQNVGIGVTDPDVKLEVAGDIKIEKGTNSSTQNVMGIGRAGNIEGSGGGNAFLTVHGNTNNQRGQIELGSANRVDDGPMGTVFFYNLDNGSSVVSRATIQGERDGADDASKITFATEATSGNVTERMVIKSTGNVGIGETSPSSKLVVKGAMAVNDSSGNGYINISSEDTSTSSYGGYFKLDNTGVKIGNNTSARDLRLQTDNTARLTILGGGNVGIGDTSPTEGKLVVSGTGGSASPALHLQISDSSTFNHFANMINPNLAAGENGIIVFGLEADTKNSAWIGYKHRSDHGNDNQLSLGFWGANNLVNILPSGRMGINTETPSQALHVVGNAHVETGGIRIVTNGQLLEFGDSNVHIDRAGNSMNLHAYAGHIFSINGETAVTIDNSGHLSTSSGNNITAGGQFLAGTGGASAPGISFSNDTNTGIYNNGSNDNLQFSTAGVHRAFLSATQFNVTGNIIGSGTVTGTTAVGVGANFTWTPVSGTNYVQPSSWIRVNTVGLYSGTNGAHLYPNQGSDYGAWRMNGSRGGWGGIAFEVGGVYNTLMSNASTMGMYNDTDNEWMLECTRNGAVRLYYNATIRVETTSTGAKVVGNLRVDGGGNASDPLITTQGDTNTGIYFPGSGKVGVGGTGGLEVENGGTFGGGVTLTGGNAEIRMRESGDTNYFVALRSQHNAGDTFLLHGLKGEFLKHIRTNDSDENTHTLRLGGALPRVDIVANNSVRMLIDQNGSTTFYGKISATSKAFVIDHPTKEGKKLEHGSLEGPENGVYVRGKCETNIIELPDYWTGLVDEDTITVQITPIGGWQQIYVEKIKDNKVYVGNPESDSFKFFYNVYGERKDIDKMEVEY